MGADADRHVLQGAPAALTEQSGSRLDEAIAAYEHAVETDGPDSPAAANALGSMLVHQGRHEEALEAYQRALDSGDPDAAPKAALGIGGIRWEQERFDDAAAAYQLAIEAGHSEQSGLALYNLGIVREAQGRRDEALTAYRAASDSGYAEAMRLTKRRLRELRREQSRAWQALPWLLTAALAVLLFLPGLDYAAGLGAFALLLYFTYGRRGALASTRDRVNAGLLVLMALLLVLPQIWGAPATVSAFLVIPFVCALAVSIAVDPELRLPVSTARRVRLAIWCCTLAVAYAIGTMVVVRQAPSHAADHSWYPQGWSLVCVAAILFLALLGGLWVFQQQAGWMLVGEWSIFGVMLAWLVQELTSVAMGATRAHGVIGSCLDHHKCDAFAYLAGFYLYGSPALAAGLFFAAFGAKRLLFHRGGTALGDGAS